MSDQSRPVSQRLYDSAPSSCQTVKFLTAVTVGDTLLILSGLTLKETGAFKRNYPSIGSSVLLPLRLNGTYGLPEAKVMVCRGAPCGAFIKPAGNNLKSQLLKGEQP